MDSHADKVRLLDSKPVSPSLFAHFVLRTANREPLKKWYQSVLNARLVFENDSVTNIAHQIGYFETIAGGDVFTKFRARIAAVTLEEVAEAARTILTESNRTVGWFDPLPVE